MASITSHGLRAHRTLLSLTHPNRELFERHRELIRSTGSRQRSPLTGLSGFDEQMGEHHDLTFFMRIAGDSMAGMGIYDGDLLVVDRALPATTGSIIIAVVDGEFMVKQLLYTDKGIVLRSAHPSHPDLRITTQHDFSIWGVVRWNSHKA